MTKLDWLIYENHRILDEMQHRTEVEDKAFELMAQGKSEEAKELTETLDDSLLELREWPGEEESESKEVKIRRTVRKKDIHLKVKVKGRKNVSEEELKAVQKEIAVAINKANRNRNKKISYKIIIQNLLSDEKA